MQAGVLSNACPIFGCRNVFVFLEPHAAFCILTVQGGRLMFFNMFHVLGMGAAFFDYGISMLWNFLYAVFIDTLFIM